MKMLSARVNDRDKVKKAFDEHCEQLGPEKRTTCRFHKTAQVYVIIDIFIVEVYNRGIFKVKRAERILLSFYPTEERKKNHR